MVASVECHGRARQAAADEGNETETPCLGRHPRSARAHLLHAVANRLH